MSPTDPGPALVILAAGRARRYGGCKPLAPIGTSGEPVIDLLASDALAAGFATIVLVVGPATGPAIRYHVEHCWPEELDVRFALQEVPLGTVHAVLSATDHLKNDDPFAVANADDLYGEEALRLLVAHLQGGGPENALVGYELKNAVIGGAPVTRGVCRVGPNGLLEGLEERRQVVARPDGSFEVNDGREPAVLDGDALVSMNLWGFGPAMRRALEVAMEEAEHASEDAEVLLPEVVGRVVADQGPDQSAPFRVLRATGLCLGVTHPEDLVLVQAEIARQVGAGLRPFQSWSTLQRRESG
jgi:CTP:molybdopterin cytidylyltransferase MocA